MRKNFRTFLLIITSSAALQLSAQTSAPPQTANQAGARATVTSAAPVTPERFEIGAELNQIAFEQYQEALFRPARASFQPVSEFGWQDVEVFIGYPRPGMRDVPQLLMVQAAGAAPVAFGFRQHRDGREEFILDSIGDGLLDRIYTEPLIPFWVLYQAGGNPSPRDGMFLLLLDAYLEGLENPRAPQGLGRAVDEVLDMRRLAGRDPSINNRDLYFHLNFPEAYGEQFPEDAYYAWMYMGSLIRQRYGRQHPLPAIMAMRSAWELGRETETREWLGFLQQIRRGTVAAQIYDVLTERDPVARERKRQWVINNNPGHWWVEQKLSNPL